MLVRPADQLDLEEYRRDSSSRNESKSPLEKLDGAERQGDVRLVILTLHRCSMAKAREREKERKGSNECSSRRFD